MNNNEQNYVEILLCPEQMQNMSESSSLRFAPDTQALLVVVSYAKCRGIEPKAGEAPVGDLLSHNGHVLNPLYNRIYGRGVIGSLCGGLTSFWFGRPGLVGILSARQDRPSYGAFKSAHSKLLRNKARRVGDENRG